MLVAAAVVVTLEEEEEEEALTDSAFRPKTAPGTVRPRSSPRAARILSTRRMLKTTSRGMTARPRENSGGRWSATTSTPRASTWDPF